MPFLSILPITSSPHLGFTIECKLDVPTDCFFFSVINLFYLCSTRVVAPSQLPAPSTNVPVEVAPTPALMGPTQIPEASPSKVEPEQPSQPSSTNPPSAVTPLSTPFPTAPMAPSSPVSTPVSSTPQSQQPQEPPFAPDPPSSASSLSSFGTFLLLLVPILVIL